MRDVVVLGVGMHGFGRFPEESYGTLGRVAIKNALSDARAEWKDVQAVYAASMYFGSGWGNCIAWEMGLTGVPIYNLEAACCSGGVAFLLGYQAVAAGLYDIVCIVGAEKQPRGLISLPRYPEWQRRMGLIAGPAFHGVDAQRHMYLYGTTREQLAKVSIKSHNNASLCPYAHYRENVGLTVEDVLSSRMISDPLTLLQLAPTSEGAAAAILCAKELASKYSARELVHVAACVGGTDRHNKFRIGVLDTELVRDTSWKAYQLAGIGPEDIDIMEVGDVSTSEELWMYESLGICREGESGRLIDEGQTQIDGRIPVNTDGGHMSRGNPMGAAGLAQIAEIVWQLRGEAGPRQVKDAKVGLGDSYGDGLHCVITILRT